MSILNEGQVTQAGFGGLDIKQAALSYPSVPASRPAHVPDPAHPALDPAAYLIDKVTATVWCPAVHPGIILPAQVFHAAERAVAASGGRLRLRRMAPAQRRRDRDANYVVHFQRGHVRVRQLVGPSSYAAVMTFSPIRVVRQILEVADMLRPYEPPSDRQDGNVIVPWGLEMAVVQLQEMVRDEAVQRLLELPGVYVECLREVLGVEAREAPQVSLVAAEVAWDVLADDPDAFVRSVWPAVKKNLLHDWRRGAEVAEAGRPTPKPVSRFAVYSKVPAEGGRPGIARIEVRFRKEGVRRGLGTVVLPETRQGVKAAMSALAAEAGRFLREIEVDRTAARRRLAPVTLLPVISGNRRHDVVASVLGQLARDGRVRVAPEARRLVARLEAAGVVRRLLFRRPPFRKLAPGLDLSGWLDSEQAGTGATICC